MNMAPTNLSMISFNTLFPNNCIDHFNYDMNMSLSISNLTNIILAAKKLEELDLNRSAARQDFALNGVDVEYNSEEVTINSTKERTPQKKLFDNFSEARQQTKSHIASKPYIKKSRWANAQKLSKTKNHCVFCENNGEPEYVYLTHKTRDEFGRVLCPHLRNYKCPICGANGDQAHTLKYCPEKPIVSMEDTERHPIRIKGFKKRSVWKPQLLQ